MSSNGDSDDDFLDRYGLSMILGFHMKLPRVQLNERFAGFRGRTFGHGVKLWASAGR
jgi:hypothetical protein